MLANRQYISCQSTFNASSSKSGQVIVYDLLSQWRSVGEFYARSQRRASPNEQPGLRQ